jgi:hypothetical protein
LDVCSLRFVADQRLQTPKLLEKMKDQTGALDQGTLLHTPHAHAAFVPDEQIL